MIIDESSERRHKAVMVEVGDYKEEIDEAIAPLIAAIWRAGIETIMSCQETWPGLAWIEFASVYDLTMFLNLVAHYETGVDTLYNRINYKWTGEMSAPVWDYQVNLMDMNEIEGYDGPTDFGVTVGVYFPAIDIPVLVERLAQVES